MNKLEQVAREIGIPVEGDAGSKHTQGKWFTTPMKNGVHTKLTDADTSEVAIATIHKLPYRSELERDANARLIAAAPDLLETLTLFVAWVDETNGLDRSQLLTLYEQAKDDIAKSQGK